MYNKLYTYELISFELLINTSNYRNLTFYAYKNIVILKNVYKSTNTDNWSTILLE